MSTVDDLLALKEQTQTLSLLRRLADVPADTPIRIIGKIEEEKRVGKVLMWPAEGTWNVYFVGYHVQQDESTSNVPTRFYRAYPIAGGDLDVLKLDIAIVQQAVLSGVAEAEAIRKVKKALEYIDGTEKRLLAAEDRFREGYPAKVAECARARAEMMPLREILRG